MRGYFLKRVKMDEGFKYNDYNVNTILDRSQLASKSYSNV